MDARAAASSLSVVESPLPAFTADDALAIAARVFGVEGLASPLSSERDQAFLVDDGAGGGGVLKISNAAERPAVIDMEAAAVMHALTVDPDLPVARPLARRGAAAPDAGPEAFRSIVQGTGSARHIVRMFERLPGAASVDGSGLGPAALRDFGSVLARLGRALRGFSHEMASRPLLWDLQHVLRLRPWLADIEDDAGRALVARALDRFEERVSPRWPKLRSQVIHGDLTLDNALLDERPRVTGIVDFGDMSHTALVVDLSSALESVLRRRSSNEIFPAMRSMIDGYESVTALEPLELELMTDLVAARTAMTLTIACHQSAQDPGREHYLGASAPEFWELLELLDAVTPERAAAELGVPAQIGFDALRARRERVVGASTLAPLTYDPPVYLVRGEGTFVFDDRGTRYLDAYNNVPVLGHAHPRVTAAISRQVRRLATNMRYLHHEVVELAERIVETMPAGSGLDTVLFVNSGSEANDLAWRIARAWTKRSGAIVTGFAYHGITDAIVALSPEVWRRDERPIHVETIEPPDARLFPVGGWAEQVSPAAERLTKRDVAPAAVVIDAAFTSDGIFRPGPEVMVELVRRAHDSGALYIADEVQIGHGRSGEHLWSFVADGIMPDLVTLGKPMGNGFPVAAVVARAELVERFGAETEFFSTYGGSPVAAAAARAVLDVIEDEGLIARARRVGRLLAIGLGDLAAAEPRIRAVRERGLLLGVELAAESSAASVMNRMRDRGFLIGRTGPKEDVLKIRPPLSITEEEAAPIVPALADSIAGAAAQGAEMDWGARKPDPGSKSAAGSDTDAPSGPDG
jgi:4-aminobutyrate aminotransferase-like enzyme/Ser/Thr protein kinase RdoA (MazF antagonist)